MKPLEEIEYSLIKCLIETDNTEYLDTEIYLNQAMGNTSIYLTAILHTLLREEEDWDNKRWLDDSLITKYSFEKKVISIWGVVISGREGTTKQWTDPFFFEMKLNSSHDNFLEYSFLFGDTEIDELDYLEYSNSRGFWDRDFYSNNSWNSSERDWKYIINKKAVLS